MNPKRQLIEACIEGDRKAQEELYKACFSPLMTICNRFANSKDDAAVLLNGAFLKIFQNIKKQNPDIPFMAWARRITVNHCINEYRKNKTRSKHIDIAEDNELDYHANSIIPSQNEKGEYPPETLKRVRQEILNLPNTTQEVFQLFVFEGLSHQEIAQNLGMKEGTSKWHVNNARKILKNALKQTLKVLSSIAL